MGYFVYIQLTHGSSTEQSQWGGCYCISNLELGLQSVHTWLLHLHNLQGASTGVI